jgi:hypothetical protein
MTMKNRPNKRRRPTMSNDITNEYLDGLEKLCKAATPGEWEKIKNARAVCGEINGTLIVLADCLADCDAAFIAAANPTAVLGLIAEIRRVNAERDEWQRRAGAGEKDIGDMLYESCLLTDDDLCVWCKQYYHGACFAQDCKAERSWRGPCADNTKGGPTDDDA